jgi:hypothetical protein
MIVSGEEGSSWLLLSGAVMGEIEVLALSYTEWRRWHT